MRPQRSLSMHSNGRISVATTAKRARRSRSSRGPARIPRLLFLLAAFAGFAAVALQARYTVSLQSPVRVGLQWPVVIAPRVSTDDTAGAQADQSGHRLTAYQQYACNKFGPACRVALAVARAENPRGACEIYHYNTDGTLDWGFFQINTVHLKRAGVNLRDLLDCQANIDFAYQLYRERGFEPWTTYTSGLYRHYLRDP
jgi:hypothetical protein